MLQEEGVIFQGDRVSRQCLVHAADLRRAAAAKGGGSKDGSG